MDSRSTYSLVQKKEVFSPATKAMDLMESSAIKLDDNLTSLQWLQEGFSFSGSGKKQVISNNRHESNHFEHQLGEEVLSSSLACDLGYTGVPLTHGMPNLAAHGHCQDEPDYKTNPIKPPCTYDTLICIAMQTRKERKITLSGIYKWITENFCYFRIGDTTWQNTIRHNLSVNKAFIKVKRQKNERGKGGYWKVDPAYALRLLTAAFKKHCMSPVQINTDQHRMISPPDINVPTNVSGVHKVSPVSQQFLEEFEQLNEFEQKLEPHLTEATSVNCWSTEKGCKRKLQCDHQERAAKIMCCSSSPAMEEHRNSQDRQNSTLDWDDLLHSVLNEDWNLNDDVPLSPIQKDQDHMTDDMHVSSQEDSGSAAENNMLTEALKELDVFSDEETFFDVLQSIWKEDEDVNQPNFVSTTDINESCDLGPIFITDIDCVTELVI